MTNTTTSLRPRAVQADAGEALWWAGSLAVIKATAADTGGAMTVLEVTEAPGARAPLHVHHGEDEGFWLLDGRATFEVGGETIEARAGDYVFGPRGIPHRYTAGPDGCRMLFLLTPGGFEELVRGMSTPAAARTLPPADAPPPSTEELARMEAAVKAHGCEILG